MDEKKVSIAVVKRLPRYYRYLGELMLEGYERISSKELSEIMKITASQIRQDLNNFGGFGQQGYGYNVKYLHGEIAKILGIDEKKTVIIIGVGNFGQTLSNYTGFAKRGFNIKALFDKDEKLVGKKFGDAYVYSMSELEPYATKNKIDIAVLTIPKSCAQEVADRVVKAGIKGIWNFAHTDLVLPDNVSVENVHLSESLMRLSYKMKNGWSNSFDK